MEKWAILLADRKKFRWTPHQVRHTFGEQAGDRFGIEHVQHALGHSDPKMSVVYAGVSKAKAREVAAAIG